MFIVNLDASADGEKNQPAEIKVESTMTRLERLTLRLGEELWDEAWPDFYLDSKAIQWRARLDPHIYDSQKWEDIEDDGIDVFEDAFRHLVIRELKDSMFAQSLENRVTSWFDLKVNTYFRRPGGPHESKELTIDTEIQLADVSGKEQKRYINLGVRFRNLSKPGIYAQYNLGGNGNGQKLEHELFWLPTSQTVQYLVTGVTNNLDFRLEYDYQDEVAEFRFLNAPRWFQFSDKIGGRFSVRHDFQNGNSSAWFQIFGRF